MPKEPMKADLHTSAPPVADEPAAKAARPAIGGQGDHPVFVTNKPWRGRGVSIAVALTGALLLSWLAAILAGALGFGSLPGVPLAGGGTHARSAPRPSWSAPRAEQRRGGQRIARPRTSIASRDGDRSQAGDSGSGLAGTIRPSPAGTRMNHDHATTGSAATPALSPTANAMPAKPEGPGVSAGPPASPPAGAGPANGAGSPPRPAPVAEAAPPVTPSGAEVPSGSRGSPSSKSYERKPEAPGQGLEGTPAPSG